MVACGARSEPTDATNHPSRRPSTFGADRDVTVPGKRRIGAGRLRDWRCEIPDRPVTVIVAVVGAFLLARLLLPQATPSDLAADLKATASQLLAGEGEAHGDPGRALIQLAKIAVRIGKDGRLAQPLQARLEAVLERITEDPPGDQTRSALTEAFAAFHEGREFSFPTGVTSIDGARAAAQAEVDHCLRALEAGHAEESAGALLGVLMLVMTPMDASA